MFKLNEKNLKGLTSEAIKEYNSISSKNEKIKDNLSHSILGEESNLDSLAFITFIIILQKKLEEFNFKTNLAIEISKKNMNSLDLKNLIKLIDDINQRKN